MDDSENLPFLMGELFIYQNLENTQVQFALSISFYERRWNLKGIFSYKAIMRYAVANWLFLPVKDLKTRDIHPSNFKHLSWNYFQK